MANEASLRVRIEEPLPFTVADGTGIEKGATLRLTDPRTAAANTANGQMAAGIAAREKVASDGRTELAVYRRGWFDMKCSGAVVLGSKLVFAGGDNCVVQATSAHSGAAVIGTALETGADNEVILVDLNIGGGGVGG